MLEILLPINFLGMILLPIFAWIYFTKKFSLSWKLLLAGGLTFIASQIIHAPLVIALTPTFQAWGLVPFALTLGLLAGLFEETARYILYKFILKKTNTWNEGVYVGLGHGGTEAIIFGILGVLTFVNMLVYRNIDLSTIPSIPPEQLELARQQVDAFWSTPPHLALLGMVERAFAICLHVALSVMVLYGLVKKQHIWFWLAVLWHAVIDAGAVYLVQQIDPLVLEGIIGVGAAISIVIVLWLKPKFPMVDNAEADEQANETGAG